MADPNNNKEESELWHDESDKNDLTKSERRRRNSAFHSWHTWFCVTIIMASAVFLATFLLVGLVIMDGNKNNDNNNSNNVSTQGEGNPTERYPSPMPSAAPTGVPSQAPQPLPSLPPVPPTGDCDFVAGAIVPEFPQANQPLLDIPGTCQHWARTWLAGSASFNVTELPHWRVRQRYTMALLYCEWQGDFWGTRVNPEYEEYAAQYRYECHYDLIDNLTGSTFDNWFPWFHSGHCRIRDGDSISNNVYTIEMAISGDNGPTLTTVENVPEQAIKFFQSPPWSSSFQRQEWLQETHECDWFPSPNVMNCDTEGKLYTLRLPNMNLSGTIPPELSMLSHLWEFSVPYNPNLRGSIPNDIKKLSDLVFLDITHTQLSAAIGDLLLEDLQYLFASSSQLHGTIPDDTYLVAPNLQGLFVGEARLEGRIPDTFQYLQWKFLHLSSNQLNGTIPVGLNNGGGWMQELWLYNNSFSDAFPVLNENNDVINGNPLLQDVRTFGNPNLVGEWGALCPLMEDNGSGGKLTRLQVDLDSDISSPPCGCCTAGGDT